VEVNPRLALIIAGLSLPLCTVSTAVAASLVEGDKIRPSQRERPIGRAVPGFAHVRRKLEVQRAGLDRWRKGEDMAKGIRARRRGPRRA
jgi:hypothetical protein